jgi:hypothetical protein
MTLILRAISFTVNLVNIFANVYLLYKPGYIIPGAGNLTKENPVYVCSNFPPAYKYQKS